MSELRETRSFAKHECPICHEVFPMARILTHADQCARKTERMSNSKPKPSTAQSRTGRQVRRWRAAASASPARLARGGCCAMRFTHARALLLPVPRPPRTGPPRATSSGAPKRFCLVSQTGAQASSSKGGHSRSRYVQATDEQHSVVEGVDIFATVRRSERPRLPRRPPCSRAHHPRAARAPAACAPAAHPPRPADNTGPIALARTSAARACTRCGWQSRRPTTTSSG